MRLTVGHDITWTWDTPPRSVVQHLRIEPRNHEGQHVIGWRTDVEPDGRMRMGEDAFGNAFDSLTVEGPLSQLTVRAAGEVETFDTNGFVRHTVERFPPELFLRETALTQTDRALRDFANDATSHESEALGRAHALLKTVHERLGYATTHDDLFAEVAKTLAAKRGNACDLAHVFIAAARHLGIPARIAVGHLFTSGKTEELGNVHAWSEAYIAGYGWIGFDPVTGFCPEGAHVRLAIGVDALDALPVRGAHHGGTGQRITHRITIRAANGRPGG